MKKLLSVTLVLCCLSLTMNAQQNNEVTNEDYDRYFDKKLEMDFRLKAMEAIDLTPEEINAFNPIFDNYVRAKDKIADRKFDALEDYSEDMDKETAQDEI